MAKTPKFDDVKHPDKVTPSATARPIIVSNHPMITKDPMMAPASADPLPNEEPVSAGSSMSHSKTILPINALSTEPEADKKDTPAELDAPKEPELTVESEPEKEAEPEPKPAEVTPPEPEEAAPPAPEPKSESEVPGTLPETDVTRDPDAELTAEETAAVEAKARREQELEDIIASGKYVVPIDAVQRRRSRIATTLLFVLAVLLALVLLDVAVDVGIVHVPSSVPHTHLFSKK